MPATYTYNDALEDAKSAVAHAWEDGFEVSDPERHMKIMLDIIGRLDRLKRPSRRKRRKLVEPSPELTDAPNRLLPPQQS